MEHAAELLPYAATLIGGLIVYDRQEMIPKLCSSCQSVDTLFGVHPMRCSHESLTRSLPVSVMRDDGGLCGPGAILWQPIDQRQASIGGDDDS